MAEIIIGKQRNGPIGICRLAFIGQFTRFENLARGLTTSNALLVKLDRLHGGLQVVLQAHFLDQSQLGFQPVNVLFFRCQDIHEQLPRGEIGDRFAVGDGVLEVDVALVLQFQVALEHFLVFSPM